MRFSFLHRISPFMNSRPTKALFSQQEIRFPGSYRTRRVPDSRPVRQDPFEPSKPSQRVPGQNLNSGKVCRVDRFLDVHFSHHFFDIPFIQATRGCRDYKQERRLNFASLRFLSSPKNTIPERHNMTFQWSDARKSGVFSGGCKGSSLKRKIVL